MIGTEAPAASHRTLKSGFEQAIRRELDEMLSAPIFAQSARCKKFLSFIVSETLAGNSLHLKERTIGINVFQRANDYDTGDDSIVRVTANEVRKRIGQFYLESAGTHTVHIELPRGAYVPEFRVNPAHPSAEETAIPSKDVFHQQDAGMDHDLFPTLHDPEISLAAPLEQHAAVLEPIHPEIQREVGRRPDLSRVFWILSLFAVVVLCSGLAVWRVRSQHVPPDVWTTFRNSEVPVLICLGAHDLPPANWTMTTSDADRFPNLVLRRQVIPIDDAAVIANLGSLLGIQKVPFRVTSADPTTLSDLRRQPVILVGALDNKWSLRLSEGLPYHLERVYTSGQNGLWNGSIIDSKNPDHRWKVDFTTPMSEWQHDYAIVARFDDSLTGVPVLLEAGLGNNGSLAASEFLSSHELDASLADEPSCRGKKSFEVVIDSEIIDAKPGRPHALRVTCW